MGFVVLCSLAHAAGLPNPDLQLFAACPPLPFLVKCMHACSGFPLPCVPQSVVFLCAALSTVLQDMVPMRVALWLLGLAQLASHSRK